jgi:hypothetical protein
LAYCRLRLRAPVTRRPLLVLGLTFRPAALFARSLAQPTGTSGQGACLQEDQRPVIVSPPSPRSIAVSPGVRRLLRLRLSCFRCGERRWFCLRRFGFSVLLGAACRPGGERMQTSATKRRNKSGGGKTTAALRTGRSAPPTRGNREREKVMGQRRGRDSTQLSPQPRKGGGAMATTSLPVRGYGRSPVAIAGQGFSRLVSRIGSLGQCLPLGTSPWRCPMPAQLNPPLVSRTGPDLKVLGVNDHSFA